MAYAGTNSAYIGHLPVETNLDTTPGDKTCSVYKITVVKTKGQINKLKSFNLNS